jgi:hypothetical protein
LAIVISWFLSPDFIPSKNVTYVENGDLKMMPKKRLKELKE